MIKKFIRHQAEKLGGDPQATIPDWIHSFGIATETYTAINSVVAVDENSDNFPMSTATGSTASSSSRDRVGKRRSDSVMDEKRKKLGLDQCS